ncbi:MAG TPA: nitronate monooxygenase [Tepidisphaeraceae bacterium]|nr:nitronate monooxygenase [Tepidisphaeraceae bacterium]
MMFWGAKYPIILAPMGGVGTVELAAAVCNAGGVGSLAAAYLSPQEIKRQIEDFRSRTDRPFAINLFAQETKPLDRDPGPMLSILTRFHEELGLAPPTIPQKPAEVFEEQVAAVLEARVPIYSFTLGIPRPKLLADFKSSGTIVAGTATTLAEAIALRESGVDAIVAQGAEAGAHRGTFLDNYERSLVPTATLVKQICNAISLPVIASGGIRDGKAVAGFLHQGAAAVQIGTAFIPCPESSAPDVYKRAIMAAQPESKSVITRAFSGKPARGLSNRFIEEIEKQPQHILPFPWQNAATRALRNAAAKAGRGEFLSLWSGQGTAPLRQMPADLLLKTLVKEAGL